MTLLFLPYKGPIEGPIWAVYFAKKIGFGAGGRFSTFFDLFFDVKNISFGKSEFFGRTLNKNRKAISLVLILST